MHKTIQLVLASTNAGKVREFARLLADPRLEIVSMSSLLPEGFNVEETGATFSDNAWLKAIAVCQATGLCALADDSGLVVDALGGRPGVYSARYAGLGASDQQNNERLLMELAVVPPEQRTARFVCALAVAVPSEQGPRRLAEVEGTIEGRITTQARGAGGFGYDPLFEPLAFPNQTTAELPGAAKDQISHRGRAARDIMLALRLWLDGQVNS